MQPLGPDSRVKLLRLARQAIECALRRETLAPVECEGPLAERCGVFVTLTRGERLRGCIGQVEPVDPLALAVTRAAVAAATEDSRFPPVVLAELPEIEIELSVLSLVRRVCPGEIIVGRHGLMITRGYRRGLLLPQVAAHRDWTVDRFLAETCEKAGLDREAWKQPGTEIAGFEAAVFGEREVHAALRQA